MALLSTPSSARATRPSSMEVLTVRTTSTGSSGTGAWTTACLDDRLGNGALAAGRVHDMQHRARAVELDERLRSLLEDAQTVPDDIRRPGVPHSGPGSAGGRPADPLERLGI